MAVLLAFTEQPFWWYYNLGRANSSHRFTNPQALILLGGGGMPSESNLIRGYYTYQLSNKYKQASIIIALPDSTENTVTSNSSLLELKKYLILLGTDSTRIRLENQGRNTRQQALNIIKKWPFLATKPILLITSPEHMYRSINTFKKAGFKLIGGEPCFEFSLESDLNYNDNQLGGRKLLLSVGNKKNLRYQFWNHLKYEILVVREKVAYFYYFLRGWV